MARRAAGRGLAVLAGAAGLAGYLLVSGALQPVVADVLALAGHGDAEAGPQIAPVAAWSDPQGTTGDWANDSWMTGDGRAEWSNVRQVPQTGRVGGPSLPVRPVIAPPENPKRIYRGMVPPNDFSIKLQPMPSCPQQVGPGATVKNLTVTPGTGGVQVSWWNIGDPDTTAFVVQAVPVGGSRGTPGSVTVASPKGCTQTTARLTGLTSGQRYAIWLSAVNTSSVNGREYRPSRGQSEAFMVG